MVQPTRKYQAGSVSYRYSINGQEKENEINENITTAFFWEYDSRTARRWNNDPLMNPSESPYACMKDNPVLYNDPNGKTGIVTIDKQKGTITVTSTYFFYGNGASVENAKKIAKNIETQWNAAQGRVEIDGKCYSVNFVVKSVYIDVVGRGGLERETFKTRMRNNTNYEENYIKVSVEGPGALGTNTDPLPGSKPGGNSGHWKLADVNGDNSTSGSHEYGHGVGELSAADGGDPGHHTSENQVGKGQPGIMASRGTLVDAEFTYDPSKGNSVPNPLWTPTSTNQQKNLNTLDPSKRKVTQKDIDNLHLDKLNYDPNGKAKLGGATLTNTYHQ